MLVLSIAAQSRPTETVVSSLGRETNVGNPCAEEGFPGGRDLEAKALRPQLPDRRSWLTWGAVAMSFGCAGSPTTEAAICVSHKGFDRRDRGNRSEFVSCFLSQRPSTAIRIICKLLILHFLERTSRVIAKGNIHPFVTIDLRDYQGGSRVSADRRNPKNRPNQAICYLIFNRHGRPVLALKRPVTTRSIMTTEHTPKGDKSRRICNLNLAGTQLVASTGTPQPLQRVTLQNVDRHPSQWFARESAKITNLNRS